MSGGGSYNSHGAYICDDKNLELIRRQESNEVAHSMLCSSTLLCSGNGLYSLQ